MTRSAQPAGNDEKKCCLPIPPPVEAIASISVSAFYLFLLLGLARPEFSAIVCLVIVARNPKLSPALREVSWLFTLGVLAGEVGGFRCLWHIRCGLCCGYCHIRPLPGNHHNHCHHHDNQNGYRAQAILAQVSARVLSPDRVPPVRSPPCLVSPSWLPSPSSWSPLFGPRFLPGFFWA